MLNLNPAIRKTIIAATGWRVRLAGGEQSAAFLRSFDNIDDGNGFAFRTLVWVGPGGLANAGWKLNLHPHPLTTEGAAPESRSVASWLGVGGVHEIWGWHRLLAENGLGSVGGVGGRFIDL